MQCTLLSLGSPNPLPGACAAERMCAPQEEKSSCRRKDGGPLAASNSPYSLSRLVPLPFLALFVLSIVGRNTSPGRRLEERREEKKEEEEENLEIKRVAWFIYAPV